MGKNLIETIMGAVVLIVAFAFLAFAYQSSGMKAVDGYGISAKFDSVAGLSAGGDVRIGGIKIGVINELKLDPVTYQAVVLMQIKRDAKIPVDSTASVVSDGLLGGKYISIEAGGDDEMLADKGVIGFTQSSISLESLIGKFMFSGGGVDKKDGAKEPSSAPGAKDSPESEKQDASPTTH